MPHHDRNLEEQILGALMRTAASGRHDLIHDIAAAIRDVSRFHYATSRAIYTSILAILGDGGAPTADRVNVDLEQRNQFTRVQWPSGGVVYVASLADKTTIRHLAELRIAVGQLTTYSVLRGIEEACMATISRMNSADVDAADIAAEHTAAVWQAVDNGNGPSRGVDAAGAADVGQNYQAELLSPTESDPWLTTGLLEVDALIGRRVRPGWLVVIGAQSKVGKSVLAADILRDTGINGQRRPVYISIEMSIEELQQRIESAETEIPLDTLMDPTLLGPKQQSDLIGFRNVMRQNPNAYWIEEMPGATLPAIVSKIRLLTTTFKTKLVLIDYVQIMSLPDQRGQNRQAQIGNVSRTLKALAGELKIVIVILSQLNADMFARAKGGTAPRPAARDMRESKDLLNDANMVLLIDRPEEHDFESFHDGEECKGLARIEIAAARSGKGGWRTVQWSGETVQFRNHARFHTDPPMRPAASHYTHAADESPF